MNEHKPYKIVYINGYKETPKPSSTYLYLKKNLHEDVVIPCNWYYNNDGINMNRIKKCIEEEKPDIIVVSSTGGLIAEEFDIPKILINPVVERKDLEKLHPNKDFSNLSKAIKHNKDIKIVILSKNDERLGYKKALEIYPDAIIVDDKHRLNNKEVILVQLNLLKNILKKVLNSIK